MNILHIVHRYYPYAGGAEKYFQEISERFAAKGHHVQIFTTDAFDLEYFWDKNKRRIDRAPEVHNGVHIRRFPVTHLPLKRYLMKGLSFIPGWHVQCFTFSPPSLRLLWESLFRKIDYDIIHAGPFPFEPLIYCAYRIAKKKNVPLLITPLIHLGKRNDDNILKSYSRKSQKLLLQKSDAIFAQTTSELSFLEKWPIPKDKIHLIGMGINPSEVQGGDAQRFRHRHDITTKMVGHLAVKSFAKGTMHLIEAMSLLWGKGGNVKLCLAGHELNEFEQYYRNLSENIKKNIIRLNFIDDEEKKDFLSAIDLLALPSKTESFGIVFLEAWANKKPVIGANAGGIPDVIDSGKDGFLVEFGDIQRLSEKIMALIHDEKLALSFGENGFKKVDDHYTWERQFAKIESVYEKFCR